MRTISQILALLLLTFLSFSGLVSCGCENGDDDSDDASTDDDMDEDVDDDIDDDTQEPTTSTTTAPTTTTTQEPTTSTTPSTTSTTTTTTQEPTTTTTTSTTTTTLPLITCYQDLDLDTYGNPAVSEMFEDEICPYKWTEDNTDCDDTDILTHPDAPELPDDGISQDCVGGDLVLSDATGVFVAKTGDDANP